MEGRKRQENNTIQNFCSNKKRKLQNEITTININKSRFQDLANEIFYEIFEYLDIHHVHKGFFNLNKRFKNLLNNSNLLTKINISTISKSDFDYYYRNIVIRNKERIRLLRLSNPFTTDMIFSPTNIILKFISLEILILDNIHVKYLNQIFDYLLDLPKFHSLTISFIDYIESLDIFIQIFRLSKLEYCKIIYKIKNNQSLLPIYLTKYDSSHIQYFIINGDFPFNSLHNLLSCLPQLHHLSIDSLVNCHDTEREELSPIELKYFKQVFLKLNFIYFYKFEKIIKNFFHYIQILRLTTCFDETYLNAKQWEDLILSSMPYLRIFDINHECSIRNNNLIYHDIIDRFNSSFWFEKEWYFSHQHNWPHSLDSGIFYSTNPYRRKDYTLYSKLDQQICSYTPEMNLNSVKHVSICKQNITNSHVNYFPNVTQLTIKFYTETFDELFTTTLNHLIPLIQLTTLVIEYSFSFENIIKLLSFTSNLCTLKLNSFSPNKINSNLIIENEIFQYVSKINKIKNLDIKNCDSLDNIQLIVNLLSQLEYFKVIVNRNEIKQLIRFLLSKSNTKTQHLFFLCISDVPVSYPKELKTLIRLENLLHDYRIKYLNRDLYIWW